MYVLLPGVQEIIVSLAGIVRPHDDAIRHLKLSKPAIRPIAADSVGADNSRRNV